MFSAELNTDHVYSLSRTVFCKLTVIKKVIMPVFPLETKLAHFPFKAEIFNSKQANKLVFFFIKILKYIENDRKHCLPTGKIN